jgi:uncharacterized membrane protein
VTYRRPATSSRSISATREPLRRLVSRLALLAVSLGGIGAAFVGYDLATRPPCEPGYVRLVDLEPVGVILSFVLAGLALVVYWRSRSGSHLKIMTGVSVVVLVCVALFDLGAVATLVHHHGERYDADCWTF